MRSFTDGERFVTDGFAAKIDPNGNLIWNTFLGSSTGDQLYAIAVDSGGKVYVGGMSLSNWGSPIVAHGDELVQEGYVAKLTNSGSLIPPPVHTITPSSGANGTTSPAVVTDVDEGSDQIFTMVPDSHYHVQDVLIDGSSVGATTTYTFSNVTTDHTISATFEADPVESTLTPVVQSSSHSGSTASDSTLRALGLSHLITPNTPNVPLATVPGCPAGYVCRATTPPSLQGASASQVPPSLQGATASQVPPSLQGAPASQGNASTFTRNLTYKSTGSDVTTLQSILNKEGFLKVSPTGYYGPLTVAAVRAYQKAHNIPTTGTAGPITRGYLAR